MLAKLLLVSSISVVSINASYALNFSQFMGDLGRSEADRRNREANNLDRGRWDSSDLIREERTGDYSISRCIYKTINGYDFSINVRNRSCPYRVYINPETNQVQIPR